MSLGDVLLFNMVFPLIGYPTRPTVGIRCGNKIDSQLKGFIRDGKTILFGGIASKIHCAQAKPTDHDPPPA